jgi:hypothetical protein
MAHLTFRNNKTGEQTIYDLISVPGRGQIYPLWKDQYGDYWTRGILGWITVNKYLNQK